MNPDRTATHRMVAGRMRRRDRCNQCNGPIDPDGPRNCDDCRKRMALHSTDRAAYLATRVKRAAFASIGSELRLTWIPSSGNDKLGGIPATIMTPSTCPPSCAFYGNGCYGESGFSLAHWKRAGERGIGWAALLRKVRALPVGRLWRYAVVGDLPGIGERVHVGRLRELVGANRGRRGFTFTHCKLERSDERRAVAFANANGFTINLSANNLEHADELAELRIGPVAVVIPRDAQARQRTPAGRHVVLCPAQTSAELDCARCGLCAVATRKAIVAFRAHGVLAAEVSRRVALPVVS